MEFFFEEGKFGSVYTRGVQILLEEDSGLDLVEALINNNNFVSIRMFIIILCNSNMDLFLLLKMYSQFLDKVSPAWPDH